MTLRATVRSKHSDNIFFTLVFVGASKEHVAQVENADQEDLKDQKVHVV